MIFNSLTFLIFLPVVFALYWGLGAARHRAQNLLLLVASYIFYGWWDWRLLWLIMLTTVACFATAWALDSLQSRAWRRLLGVSCMVLNLGLLGYFKYANFFSESLASALNAVGIEASWPVLHVILPVGISFYTFQTLSYVIDVWRGTMRATHDLVAFSAYVAFFPQLVAGPIERGKHLIPQFLAARRFDANLATDGCRQMLWGFFKKVAVADVCAGAVNAIFAQQASATGWQLLLGAVLFGFQIYGDFSGYSDIAVGCSRLFGFDLMRNFAYPYFSRDIAEFWRRWHISLTTWFRDYLYIPLGGSRCGKWRTLFNTMVVFLVSGLWHGANWRFVVWGALHALFFAPLLLLGRNRVHTGRVVAEGRILPRWHELGAMLWTFALVSFAWIFFRSADVSSALGYITGFFTHSWGGGGLHNLGLGACWAGTLVMLGQEWAMRARPHGLDIGHWPVWLRWAAYFALGWSCLGMFKQDTAFIYFQF